MTITHAPERDLASIFANAVETVRQGIAIYDRDESLIHCNETYAAHFPLLSDMLSPGMKWRDFISACIANGMAVGLERTESDWQAECDEIRSANEFLTHRRAADGRIYDLSYSPMENGGFVVTRDDVTEKVRAEAEAAHQDALLTRILETNPIPVVMARLSDSRIVWRSPATVELVGQSEYAIDHFYDPTKREEYVALLKQHGKVEDFRVLCRAANGSVISVALSGMLTEFEGETCVVSSITDLTEVLEREALLRQVIEACPAPVLMNRAETGEILYRSPELIALFGEGLDAREFYVDPKERKGFLNAIREKGEVSEYRVRFLNAAGEPFWAAVSGRMTEWEGDEVLVTFARDLSTQLAMEAELEKQREQSFRNEKLSALGGLLAGVAHELNNPLSVVVGHAMMLQEEARDTETIRKVRKISDAAERCSRIVKTFLTMAREEPSKSELVDLNEVARVAAEVARFGDDAHVVNLELRLPEDVLPVSGDVDQLTQVAINLILNAEQAIASAGVGDAIMIRTEFDKQRVRLIVEDNGPGVPTGIRKRIFEPFFTTRGVGEGTGLGLSMCYRLVTAHGGDIRFEQPERGGARFVVSLPAVEAATSSADDARTPEADGTRSCRVLVVDDEEDVADLNAEVLKRAGFDAIAVANVDDGLELMKARDFDVVVSDLNMPDKDGRALFEAIRSEYPDLAHGTGFLTGDTLGKTSQAFLAEAGRPYLEKPVSPRELRDFAARLCQERRK